jgi:hypothetical protein
MPEPREFPFETQWHLNGEEVTSGAAALTEGGGAAVIKRTTFIFED